MRASVSLPKDSQEPKMTVEGLQQKPSKIPNNTRVVVYPENGSFQMGADGVLFEKDEISLQKGTLTRKEEKVGFSPGPKGQRLGHSSR
jgi:hypothetical protein